MPRDELTDDGAADWRPAPPRTDGTARYGDRFLPMSTMRDLGRVDVAEAEGVAGDGPARSWPPWLTRGAAGLGVVATAVIAIAMGDRDEATPDAAPDAPAARTLPPHEPPPVAPLEVRRTSAELWQSQGFSYEITVTNRADEPLDVVEIGATMSGTELAWDRELVLGANQTTLVRVDFLVLNCLAATSSTAPDGLRLVVRAQGSEAVAALAEVPTLEEAAFIDAAGEAICGRSAGGFGSAPFR